MINEDNYEIINENEVKKIKIKNIFKTKVNNFNIKEENTKSYDLFSTNSNIEISYNTKENSIVRCQNTESNYQCFDFFENDEIIIPYFENKSQVSYDIKKYIKNKNNDKFPLKINSSELPDLENNILINKIYNCIKNNIFFINISNYIDKQYDPIMEILLLSQIDYKIQKDKISEIIEKIDLKESKYLKLLIKLADCKNLFKYFGNCPDVINYILYNSKNFNKENKIEYVESFLINYKNFPLNLDFILMNILIFINYIPINKMEEIIFYIWTTSRFKYNLINENMIIYLDIIIRLKDKSLYPIFYSFIIINLNILFNSSPKDILIENLNYIKNNFKNIFNNRYYLLYLEKFQAN